MNLKNTSILTIISVSSLELLSSCANKESVKKPATFSGSYKIVAFACGKVQSTFTPEDATPEVTHDFLFLPFGFFSIFDSQDRDFGIKSVNGKVSFEYSQYSQTESTNYIKCRYSEELESMSHPTDANLIYLGSNVYSIITPSATNDSECPKLSLALFNHFNLSGSYEFAQNNHHFTLTSLTNNYCNSIVGINSKEKLILTLEKE